MTDYRVLEQLERTLEAICEAQLKMTEQLVEERGHIAAAQLSIVAIAEQLRDQGNLDVAKAADRLVELAREIQPTPLRHRMLPQIDLHAERLRSISGEITKPPPHRPRLVR